MIMKKFKKRYEEPWAEIEPFTIADVLTDSGSYGDHGDEPDDPFGNGTNATGGVEF